jgi:hypothetical protein
MPLRRSTAAFAAVALLGLAAAPASGAQLGRLTDLTSVTDTTTGTRVQLVRVATPTLADKARLTKLGLDLTEHAGPD